MKVVIYTDGGCVPNPGRGGWAALIRYPDREVEIYGMEPLTTNNRMELTAAIKALESLSFGSEAQVFTDSEYLKRGITEWLPNWRRRGWKRKGGTLANQDLWMKLDLITQKIPVNWSWVRGHAGNKMNERVDQLVGKAISQAG
jgi:ribonuclease HI